MIESLSCCSPFDNTTSLREPGQTVVVEESLYYVYADLNLCKCSFTGITGRGRTALASPC